MASCRLLLLATYAVGAHATAATLTCTTRYVPYSAEGTNATIAMIECASDIDLYFTGKTGSTYEGPFSSTATEAELTAAGVPANQNFAGTVAMGHGQNFPGQSMMWHGNFKVKCGAIELDDGPCTGTPTNYAFIPPPTEDPMNAVMKVFGAIVTPTAPINKKISVVMFVHNAQTSGNDPAPTITRADWDACVAAGTAKFQITGVDKTSMTSPAQGSHPFTLTDASKVPITADSTVTKEALDSLCTKDGAMKVGKDMEALDTLLATSVTKAALDAAKATLNAITGTRMFCACNAVLEGMYSIGYEKVALAGTKACLYDETTENAAWAADACCSRVQGWSKCCLKKAGEAFARRCVNTEGVCNVNETKISTCDAAHQGTVRYLIEQVVAPSVFDVNHPEFGCDITAYKNANDKMWSQFSGWMDKCYQQVKYGKTKQNRDTCAINADCWSGSCKTDWGGRCTGVGGGAMAEPMFRCMMQETDGMMIGKFLAASIGYDPTAISSTSPGSDAAFVAALAKFRNVSSEETCAGDRAQDGWCTNSLTKVQCELLAFTEASFSNSNEYTRVKWVVNPSDSAAGWCLQTHWGAGGACNGVSGDCGWGGQFSYQGNEIAQTACNAATSAISACVVDGATDSTSFVATEGACTGAGKTWVNYGAGTYHRLESAQVYVQNVTTGNWAPQMLTGDEAKCEAEKGCNWDPEARMGGTTESACTTQPGVADGGNQMFCGDCNTPNRCWQRFSMATCAVRPPWTGAITETTTGSALCAETGHADWGSGVLAAATYDADLKKRGDRIWGELKCHRDDAAHDTVDECLPSTICPAKESAADNPGGDVWDCGQAFCFDPTKTTDTACWSASGHWWGHMANGAGLCRMPALVDKTNCENAANHRWWEGRIWINGMMDTQAKCETGYCQDGKPGQETRTTCDSSKTCTRQCALCVSDEREDATRNRMCYDSTKTTLGACQTTGYEWDAIASQCKKTGFKGTEADCTALGASHVYKDCGSFTKAQCQVGCEISGDQSTCSGNCGSSCEVNSGNDQYRKQWDWPQQKCYAKDFRDPTLQERRNYPTAAKCTGVTNPGTATWTTASTVPNWDMMAALQCRWSDWAECPDQTQCEAAGECSDWMFERGGGDSRTKGSCVKDPEVCTADGENCRAGDRQNCNSICQDGQSGAGCPTLDWADDFGCIDPSITVEATCNAKSGHSWKSRAATSAECTAHGGICKNKFQDWRLHGGSTEADCGLCTEERYWKNKANWRGGIWQKPSMWIGSWKKREWTSKNSWTSTVVRHKLEKLANQAISRLFGEVARTQVKCKLSPVVSAIKVVGCACGSGASSECATLLANSKFTQVPLSTSTLFCGELGTSPPVDASSGSVAYSADSVCSDSTGGSQTDAVDKIAISDAVVGRRLSGRRLSTCAKHAIIKSAAGAACGQKMGTGISSVIAKVNICVPTTVPSGEVCSEFGVKDFAVVFANGSVATQALTVTEDAQGRYCAETAIAGMHIPILKTASCSVTASESNVLSTQSALIGLAGGMVKPSVVLAMAVACLWVGRYW